MKQQPATLSARHQLGLPHQLASPGGPVMLFLHGFPEAAFVWDAMLAHFSDENGGYFVWRPICAVMQPPVRPAMSAAYRAKHLVQDLVALKDIVAPTALGLSWWPMTGAALWLGTWPTNTLSDAANWPSSTRPTRALFCANLQSSPEQQAASAYMNFLIRPDAEVLLAEDDYRRLWAFFTNMGAVDGPYAWLTEDVKAQYREVWSQGLTGALNYYRASPLRPPREADAAAAAITLPKSMLEILVPTLVLWGMNDIALPPGLVDGLEDYIPDLRLQRIADGSHWLVHEQPALVAQSLWAFLHTT
jgi:epoxide hydrolase 4